MPDIQSILTQMTLEEKAALCTGANPWDTTAIPRLGIPKLTVSDGPHGVRRPMDPNSMTSQSFPSTCFPTASCLASTWDGDLLREMGQALAEECISLGVDVLLGPGVNMKRSPLGGRNFEYFSEDPYLAGALAAELVAGIQSQGVGTSLKHFAVNNQEFQRFTIDAQVDQRTLREIYLPAFETVVKKTRPWTVMCAYNKLNGTHCSEHYPLLTDILKNEWGFEGFVISDWGAVHDRPASLRGGLDLEMPGPKNSRVQAVVEAVRAGKLDESVLDESVRRILRIVLKAAQTPKGGSFDQDAHHALASRIAAEGAVLLKNNGILPLKPAGHIAVIGRSAETPHFQGGGSSHINPTRVSMPFKELQKHAGDAELTYAEGYQADDCFNQNLIDQAVGLAHSSDVALLYIALPGYKESEGYDRTDLDLTIQQVALIRAVTAVQPNTVVILNNGSPITMGAWINGTAAVLEAWMMGQAGAQAIADVLYGRVNPSGRLAETFPLKLSDTPSHLNWPGGNGEVRYGEGLFIGYRYYDLKELPVQFPFGYGLSYTTFAYSQPALSATDFKDVDGLIVSVDVTNTGKVSGKDVVQVYVRDPQSGLVRPSKELKGFAKLELQPGETRRVSIDLDFRAFAYYHPAYGQWITEDGAVEILIGASAENIFCRLNATLHSTITLSSVLDVESTIREWLADPRGKLILEPMLAIMRSQLTQSMGTDDLDSGMTHGMHMLTFMLDMPVLAILHFQEKALPQSPETIVAGMLSRVHAK